MTTTNSSLANINYFCVISTVGLRATACMRFAHLFSFLALFGNWEQYFTFLNSKKQVTAKRLAHICVEPAAGFRTTYEATLWPVTGYKHIAGSVLLLGHLTNHLASVPMTFFITVTSDSCRRLPSVRSLMLFFPNLQKKKLFFLSDLVYLVGCPGGLT
jgi:hypothetical protein